METKSTVSFHPKVSPSHEYKHASTTPASPFVMQPLPLPFLCGRLSAMTWISFIFTDRGW